MKKLVVVFVLVFTGIVSYGQEGLKFGVQAGLPLSDFNDTVGVVVGADFGHMWALNETFDLGVMVGYIHGFPEKFDNQDLLEDFPSVQFLPLSASLRIWPSNSISFGAQVGQAIGINDGNDGGFYVRPQLGILMSAQTEINFSYTSISLEEANWSTITFGIMYTLQLKRPY
ncbi:hypothetical protein KO500_02465 [Cellulophaga baltica]|uniref:hypothetical protein n=1 Tax=Cellulophaga TaxID=104264 RepID=UPI001C07D18A|nr:MULTISPECIES: hypothetical protein [Cellulophaga]MBU2995274.1 hypothetical protein [Cellulophaga baltica]MDO6766669.1 hypothetical protein [Cellulophaga sp. 1_MG-2023]